MLAFAMIAYFKYLNNKGMGQPLTDFADFETRRLKNIQHTIIIYL
ncbi:MAG TPA: hypothetical protein PKI46_00085 [Bacteroidales bacterium]|nr:hypothetical protein [Bacteroidales bacterium]